jgi:hypothetical protein
MSKKLTINLSNKAAAVIFHKNGDLELVLPEQKKGADVYESTRAASLCAYFLTQADAVDMVEARMMRVIKNGETDN